MKLKNILIPFTILSIGLISIYATRKGKEKDALDKRIFTTSIVEIKESGPPKKSTPDEVEFKGGKVFSDILFEKLQLDWIKYEITKDSTFTDEDANEIQWIEGTASHTDKTDQTITITFKVENYDIEGSVKVTKKDKLKKQFEFNGREKPKKKK